MFRKMIKQRQQLSEERTLEILKEGKEGVLGVYGTDDYPYTVPVNYVFANGKIYIHGLKSGHKIDAITANEKVSFCVIEKADIVKEELTTYFRSVIVFGRARVVTDESEIFFMLSKIGEKYEMNEAAVHDEIKKKIKALACIEITVESATGKESIELVES